MGPNKSRVTLQLEPEYLGVQRPQSEGVENQKKQFMGEAGRDNSFCNKHAKLRTVTEYPGGEVQGGTGNIICKFQGEIEQHQSQRFLGL